MGCPHYDGEKRDTHFKKMVGKHAILGIALDNNCAIEYIDDTFRVITSHKRARAYKVYKKQGRICTDILTAQKTSAPLRSLLETTH